MNDLPAVGATISSQQFSQMNTAAAPLPAGASSALPPIGSTVSADQFNAFKAPAQDNVIQRGVKAYGGLVDDTTKGLASTWVDDWNDAMKNFKAGNGQIQTPQESLMSGTHVAGDAASALLAPFGAVVNILTGGQASRAINAAGNAVANGTYTDGQGKTHDLAPVLNKVNDYFDAHPDVKQAILQDIPNILQAVTLGEGGVKAAPDAIEALKPGIKAPEAIPSEPAKVTLPSGATTDAATAEALGKVANEWRSPTEQNVAGYKIPTGILEKSPEVPDFLAEQGLNPFEHIDDNGKYTTLDTADSLRETAGKDSNESMRTALKAADYSTPRTEPSDIQAGANKYLSNSYNMTPTDIESVSKNIADEVSALQRKYPKGMSLEDMHNERIAYGKNGKNSPVFDKTVTNSARANRAMADSLSNKIEAKAPKDIGYQAYNKYIKNFYRAADYLESINGKKAPVSFGQKVIRTAAKFGMAKLFDAIPGGSVIDAAIGYQVGKALERFVENMAMPQRNAFLKDLKVSDPEAFTRVKDFLDKNAKVKIDQKALPPGKAIPKGDAGNPHILPEYKGGSGKTDMPMSRDAKAVSIKNPKTGKYEKAYTSEPKLSDRMIAEKYDYDPVKKVYVPKNKK